MNKTTALLPETAYDDLMPPAFSLTTACDSEAELIFAARVFHLADSANQVLGHNDLSAVAIRNEARRLGNLQQLALVYAEQVLPSDTRAFIDNRTELLAHCEHHAHHNRHDIAAFALLDYVEEHLSRFDDVMRGLAAGCRQGARRNRNDVYRWCGQNDYNMLMDRLDSASTLTPIIETVIAHREGLQADATA